MMFSGYRPRISVLLVSCLLLGGCAESAALNFFATGVSAASQGLFSRKDVNLKEKNLAAADYLHSLMSGYVTRNDEIEVYPLEETDHAGITSEFGRVVPEEIGLRLIQLGYDNINLAAVSQSGGVSEALYRQKTGYRKPKYALTGSYLRDDVADLVSVHLRIMRQEDNRLIAGFDYMIPLSPDIRTMASTPTQIFALPAK